MISPFIDVEGLLSSEDNLKLTERRVLIDKCADVDYDSKGSSSGMMNSDHAPMLQAIKRLTPVVHKSESISEKSSAAINQILGTAAMKKTLTSK